MRKQHEDYPSNSKTVQKRKKVLKARMSVPMREDVPEQTVEKLDEAEKKAQVRAMVNRPKIRKKSFFQKLASSIIGEESGENVTDYILQEVLIPAGKSTIQDMVTSGIEMLLFGETSGRRGSRRDREHGRTIVSYGSYYKSDRDRREYKRVPGYHNRLEGISFESRLEAEVVLEGLVDLLDEYESVSIADFYELASLENMIEFTDNGWGWNNLARARVIRTRDGYEIEFPRPQRLD